MDYPELRVETDRFGPFRFCVGADDGALAVPLVRVEDAWNRLKASPLAQVANQLQREVLVQSVFGTNTIEGAELTEEETGRALQLAPNQVSAEQDIRIRNIKSAYDLAVAATDEPGWRLDIAFIRAVHSAISQDLRHPDNTPGLFRDNPKARATVVGDAAHGGRYKPPQFRGDVDRLMAGLVDWHGRLIDARVSPLVRAPLVHVYFELIHPFWDGNGRVGRVLEAAILRSAGYRYAPFALAKYYLEQIHEYFTLFNTCRKAADRGDAHPNHAFVLFHVDGLRIVIDRLHDRVNVLVGALLFESSVRARYDAGEINQRQYAIVRHVVEHGEPLPLARLRSDPRYLALYANRTDKTRQRDLARLRELGLVWTDAEGRLVAGG